MLTVAIQSREWITINREKYTRRLHLLLLDFLLMFPWDARRLKNVMQETPPDPTCGTWFGDLVSPPWQWNVYLKKHSMSHAMAPFNSNMCSMHVHSIMLNGELWEYEPVDTRDFSWWLLPLQYSKIIPLCPWSTLCSNQGLFCEKKSELTWRKSI